MWRQGWWHILDRHLADRLSRPIQLPRPERHLGRGRGRRRYDDAIVVVVVVIVVALRIVLALDLDRLPPSLPSSASLP